MEEEGYEWYLDLRKYGGVKHAGFGLGFDRMVMYVTGMANIRDVIPFPRTPKSLEFLVFPGDRRKRGGKKHKTVKRTDTPCRWEYRNEKYRYDSF